MASLSQRAPLVLKILLALAALLVGLQDMTGVLKGRTYTMKVGQTSSKYPDIIQVIPSRQFQMPQSYRRVNQIQILQDGRALRGPQESLGIMKTAGVGGFVLEKNAWVLPYAVEGRDPAKATYQLRAPAQVPWWISLPLYLSVVLVWMVPFTRRYYREHPPGVGKVAYLESARGLACLLVVTTHFFAPSYPAIFDPVLAGDKTWVSPEWWHREFPLARLVTAGPYAVDFFFVLSGFVLSLPFLGRLQSSGERFREAILKRPVRLYGVLVAVMVIVQLLRSGGYYYGSHFLPAKPWTEFFTDLTYAYTTAIQYNSVFWTITYELWGALGVYLFLWLLGGVWLRWPGYVIVFYLLRGDLYQGFLFGVVIADVLRSWRVQGPPRVVPYLAPVLLVVGLWLGCYDDLMKTPGSYDHWLHSWLPQIYTVVGGGYPMVGAVLTLLALLGWPWLQQALTRGWLILLGRLSYTIYAIHSVVFFTLGYWIFTTLHPAAASSRFFFTPDGLWHHLHALIAFAISFVVALGVAAWLTAAVDEPCVRLSQWFGSWAARRRESETGIALAEKAKP